MVPSLYVTRKRPLRTMVYSSNSGVCPGSTHPAGLRMWATLRRFSRLFRCPTYSSMSLGLFPAAGMRVGAAISVGIINNLHRKALGSPRGENKKQFPPQRTQRAQRKNKKQVLLFSRFSFAPVASFAVEIAF